MWKLGSRVLWGKREFFNYTFSFQYDAQVGGLDKGQMISLSRTMTEKELEKQAEDARKNRFRSIWIVVVSLLVSRTLRIRKTFFTLSGEMTSRRPT